MTLITLITELSTYSGVPAILLGLLFKIYKDRVLRFALLYVFGSFYGDLVDFIAYYFQIHLPFLKEIWDVLHLFSVGMYFLALTKRKNLKKKGALLALVAIFLLWAEYIIGSDGISKNLTNLICLGFAFNYFYYLYETESELFIEKNISFWLACAFFFIHAAQLFSTLLSNQIATTMDTYADWAIFMIFNLLNNLFIGFAFYRFHIWNSAKATN